MEQKSIHIKAFWLLLRTELFGPQRRHSDSGPGGASANREAEPRSFLRLAGSPGDGGTCSQEFPGPGESPHVRTVLLCIRISSKSANLNDTQEVSHRNQRVKRADRLLTTVCGLT